MAASLSWRSSLLISSLLFLFLCLAYDHQHHHQHHHDRQQQLKQLPRGRCTLLTGRPQWNRQLRWRPPTLTYALSPYHTYDRLGRNEILGVFRSALGRWEEATPLRFRESANFSTADIKVGFYKGKHGHPGTFDLPPWNLAYAFPMSFLSGTYVNVNAAEHWTTNMTTDRNPRALDLETVFVHELGHVLGLGHTSTESSVMYPFMGWRTRRVELDRVDMAGVHELFGPRSHGRRRH